MKIITSRATIKPFIDLDMTSDSKKLVFRTIEKHYPHLLEKYQKLFANSSQLPAYYHSAFSNKMKEMLQRYGLKERIV